MGAEIEWVPGIAELKSFKIGFGRVVLERTNYDSSERLNDRFTWWALFSTAVPYI